MKVNEENRIRNQIINTFFKHKFNCKSNLIIVSLYQIQNLSKKGRKNAYTKKKEE